MTVIQYCASPARGKSQRWGNKSDCVPTSLSSLYSLLKLLVLILLNASTLFTTMELHDKQAITPSFSYLYLLFIPSTLKIHGTFPWLVLVNIVQEYQVSLPSDKTLQSTFFIWSSFINPMCISHKFLFDLCHTFSLGQVRHVDWIPQSHYHSVRLPNIWS